MRPWTARVSETVRTASAPRSRASSTHASIRAGVRSGEVGSSVTTYSGSGGPSASRTCRSASSVGDSSSASSGRAHYDLGARRECDRRDLVIVGRADDAFDAPGRERGSDRVDEERLPAHRRQVLAGDAP